MRPGWTSNKNSTTYCAVKTIRVNGKTTTSDILGTSTAYVVTEKGYDNFLKMGLELPHAAIQ